MKDENCPFCDMKAVEEGVVYESDNFFMKVGFGLAAPGQVMIIPKDHYNCFAELPFELEKEYLDLREKTEEFITKNFNEPYSLEHGVYGQTVPHAHVHFIPMKSKDYEIKSVEEEIMKTPGAGYVAVDWEGVKDIYKKEHKYMFFEEKDKYYVCNVEKYKDPDKRPLEWLWRDFLTQVKGAKHIKRRNDMSEEEKKLDDYKRKITLETFRNNFNKYKNTTEQ